MGDICLEGVWDFSGALLETLRHCGDGVPCGTQLEVGGHHRGFKLCNKLGGVVGLWAALLGLKTFKGPGGTGGTVSHYGRLGGIMITGKHCGRLGDLHLA